MITRNTIKHVRSLAQKKFRAEERLFVAEGPKVVESLLRTYQPRDIFATPRWIEANPQTPATQVTHDELCRLSFLQAPQDVLATFAIPDTTLDPDSLRQGLHIALDGVRDPGNLGTIIRIAAWFGIDTIVCSPDTADAYNPKVVQATMGSLAGVRVAYADLPQLLPALAPLPIYGTLLDGENIYNEPIAADALIVFGNEANGISPEVRSLLTKRILIPAYNNNQTAESLNVAIAAAITCAEARRGC